MWIARIYKYLLLASIVSAAPDGREKRHLSYLKDLVSYIFKPRPEVPFPEFEVNEYEYRLFRIPGYEDVLIKARPVDTIEGMIVNSPTEVVQVKPFEAFIGAKNIQDTRVTFQNVNNLLSTGILNGQQARLMKKTMVPVLSGLNNVQMKTEEIIRPAPVIPEVVKPVVSISEVVKPMVAEIVEPYETKLKVEVPFEPRYSYKQIEKNGDVVTFSACNNPEVSVREIVDKSSTVPMCLRQRIEEVVSLGANPNRLTRPIQLSDSDVKIGVPRIKPLNPLPLQFNNGRYVVTESSVISENVYESEVISDKIKVSHTLGPMPPYISLSAKVSEESNPKIVNLNVDGAQIVKSYDTSVKIQDSVVFPGLHNIDGQYGESLGKVPRNLPNAFSILKERDEHETNVQTNSVLNNHNYVYVPPVTDELPPGMKHNLNIVTPLDQIINTENGVKVTKPTNNTYTLKKEKDQVKKKINEPDSNIVKSTTIKSKDSNIPKTETLAQYISQQLNQSHNHSNLFTLTKEKEDAEATHRSPLLNNFLNTTNLFNLTKEVKERNDSNTAEQAEDIIKPIGVPKEGTLSNYIFEMIVSNNTEEAKIIQAENQKSNGSISLSANNDINTSQNDSVSLKKKDIMPDVESIPRYMYKQISNTDPNQFVMIKHGEELQKNANTNAPMQSTTPVSPTTAEKQLYTNKASVESVTEVSSSKKPPVFKENDQITFTNLPKVVAYSNYKYQQSNTDGSSIKVKANKEGVSVNIDGNSQKGRGDIPEEN